MATVSLPAANLAAYGGALGRWPLAAILFVALLVRIPGVMRPLVGNFATRNVVQAMEARNWIRGEAPWWRPSLDVLVDGQPAWHLVEAPCSAYLSALGWQVFGGSLDAWGRGTSIAWWLISIALLFRLVERRLGTSSATVAAAALALSPIGIIYGQSFLLEPSVVALALAAWWSAERYGDTRQVRWLVPLSVALGLLWLSKVYMLVLALPLLAIWWNACSRERRWSLLWPIGALILAALPVAWWSWQVRQLTASAPGHIYHSFLASAADHRFPQPLLASPAFYWRFAADLFTVVLTPVGAILLLAAALNVAWRRWWPLALAGAALVIVMPRKFYEMNYYHLLFLPVWCAMLPLGWKALAPWFEARRWVPGAVLAVALLCSLRYSVRPAFVTPPEDRSVVAAALALRAVAAPEDRVIAAHGSSLDLLYYCDRRGWALDLCRDDAMTRLASLQPAGARWLVVAGECPLRIPPHAESALTGQRVAVEGDGFRIYDLGDPALAPRSTAKTAMPNAPGTK